MSTRESVGPLRDLYGIDLSPDLIGAVTEAVAEQVAAWQARPLRRGHPPEPRPLADAQTALLAEFVTRRRQNLPRGPSAHGRDPGASGSAAALDSSPGLTWESRGNDDPI